MALARVASTIQQTVLSNIRVAPSLSGLTHESSQNLFQRFFADGGYLDKNAVTERVIGAVKHFEKVDANKVSARSSFKDLGLDSLDTVELVMAMEEEFSVEMPDSEADKILSVSDAIEYFSNHPHAK